jgi:hypothetical protein
LFSFHWMTAWPPAWTLTVSFSQGAFTFNGPLLYGPAPFGLW